MNFSLSRVLTPDIGSLDHLAALAEGLCTSIDRVSQLMGGHHDHASSIAETLIDLDSRTTSHHMALLTSLRSAFITPLPRADLYHFADGLNMAVERVCNTGLLIISTEQYRLPTQAMDTLEVLGRQADLICRSTYRLTDVSELEETWIQLQRLAKQSGRLMNEWVAGMSADLLQRTYNRQREVTQSIDGVQRVLRQLITHLGAVLVRES